MANLHQQAIALAQANTSGLAARQSAISAAHPKLGSTQIANRALKQVTRVEVQNIRTASHGTLAPALNPAVDPTAATVSNGSATGDGIVADSSGGIITGSGSGGLVDSGGAIASTTSTSFWSNLTTTGKVAIVGGGLVVALLLYRHFKG